MLTGTPQPSLILVSNIPPVEASPLVSTAAAFGLKSLLGHAVQRCNNLLSQRIKQLNEDLGAGDTVSNSSKPVVQLFDLYASTINLLRRASDFGITDTVNPCLWRPMLSDVVVGMLAQNPGIAAANLGSLTPSSRSDMQRSLAGAAAGRAGKSDQQASASVTGTAVAALTGGELAGVQSQTAVQSAAAVQCGFDAAGFANGGTGPGHAVGGFSCACRDPK
jgi:hypothetical protein